MTSPLTGIKLTDVGQGYDVAIGFDNGTTVNMIGYTLQPGTQWQEGTDLQDEEHIVQIATNQTDRYARYPKVSQGDWSGGERQTFFIDPTKYFSTDGGMNVTVPGQLQLLNPRMSATLQLSSAGGNFPVASDGTNVYIAKQTDGTHNFVQATSNGSAITLTARAVSVNGATQLADVIGYSSNIAFVGMVSGGDATHGVFQISATGTVSNQMSNDPVTGTQGPFMALFNSNLYYITSNQLKFVPITAPAGNAAGSVAFTSTTDAGNLGTLLNTGTALIFSTSVQGAGTVSQSLVWSFDGANATRIGYVPGEVVGGGVVNGIAYYIVVCMQDYTQTGFSNAFGGYVVYQVDGTTISIFDDYRAVDIAFQNVNSITPTFPNYPDSNVTGDGRYLYLAMPGFPVRAYDLLTPGNPVFQFSPFIRDTGVVSSIFGHKIVTPSPNGNWFTVIEAQVDGQGILNVSQAGGVATPTGTLVSSYFDFGAPDDVKLLQKIFVDLVLPLPAPQFQIVSVGFRIDNQTVFTPMTIQTNPTTGNLFAYFPANTKAARVQLQIQLTTLNSTSPVIRSVSVKATLGRTWTFTIVADRNQRLRNQGTSAGEDTQGANAQAKIANLINCYKQAGGDMTMFIPSPTQPNGVEQVQAVLQDYKYGTNTQVGPYTAEYGNTDMEGTVQIIATETL